MHACWRSLNDACCVVAAPKSAVCVSHKILTWCSCRSRFFNGALLASQNGAAAPSHLPENDAFHPKDDAALNLQNVAAAAPSRFNEFGPYHLPNRRVYLR